MTGIFRTTGMIFFLILLCPLNGLPGTRTIDVPMTLDYDMLNALAADVVFTEPGTKASLVKTPDSCQTVTVSEPRFVETEGALFLEMRVHVQYGLSAGNHCLFPVSF
ncbi:MAG: hypothetical protein LC657_06305, partial [Desulfobacteraceae bacterium]|nr:hypothetical protein [Desulfobacteraceae bacterium]